MSRIPLDRREFLTLSLAVFVAPVAALAAEPEIREARYTLDAGILWDVFTFHLPGRITETIDRAVGRYAVVASGEGPQIANRLESRGVLRGGRWAPVEAAGWVRIAGRHSRTEVRYDYARSAIHYHHRGETFLLRRVRLVDDVVPIPPGVHVDDLVSAALNFAEGRWHPETDGSYATVLVRRRRPEREGPDDVQARYEAELATFAFRVEPDPATGHAVGLVDLVPFTSWARRQAPARVVFGADRRPAQVTASLSLGSTVTVRVQAAA